MEICNVKYSSRHFSKQPGNKLVTEASDLGPVGKPIFGRVYDDACDEGFTIISERTGREAVFAVDKRDTDGEGEVRAWELIPTKKTLRQHPHLAGLRVVVLND